MEKENIYNKKNDGDMESISFIKFPKLILHDIYFSSLSLGAKVLYAILLDRKRLSIKNDWKDKKGEPFVVFTISEICKVLACSRPTGIKTLRELDKEHGLGLIDVKNKGLGKRNIIYVKNISDLTLSEKAKKDSKNIGQVKKENLSKNFTQPVKNFNPKAVKNIDPSKNNTNKNKNKTKYIKKTPNYYQEIIGYLNKKTGKNFKYQASYNKNLIDSRLREGYGLKDFFKVIDKKTCQWQASKMEKYLRPRTLFGPKFDGYLNESPKTYPSKNFSRKKSSDKVKLKSNHTFDIDGLVKKLDKMEV